MVDVLWCIIGGHCISHNVSNCHLYNMRNSNLLPHRIIVRLKIKNAIAIINSKNESLLFRIPMEGASDNYRKWTNAFWYKRTILPFISNKKRVDNIINQQLSGDKLGIHWSWNLCHFVGMDSSWHIKRSTGDINLETTTYHVSQQTNLDSYSSLALAQFLERWKHLCW